MNSIIKTIIIYCSLTMYSSCEETKIDCILPEFWFKDSRVEKVIIENGKRVIIESLTDKNIKVINNIKSKQEWLHIQSGKSTRMYKIIQDYIIIECATSENETIEIAYPLSQLKKIFSNDKRQPAPRYMLKAFKELEKKQEKAKK